MSFVPEFEIGLWNAWILTLYLPLHPLIMMLIDKVVGTGDMFKKMEAPAYSKTERIISIFSNFVLFFGLFIYSIFLPLQLGTIWFYTGLALCVLGVIASTIAIVNIANIPLGEPWTKGLYRYSRHPMTLAAFFILISAGIASASWVFLVFSIVLIALWAILVYMNRTPRWIGMPKSAKK